MLSDSQFLHFNATRMKSRSLLYCFTILKAFWEWKLNTYFYINSEYSSSNISTLFPVNFDKILISDYG